MDFQPLLIFSLDGTRYGVDARQVRETVWLPELSPVEEAPRWVVGLFMLRGRVVPVADLHLRFAHQAQRYSLSDQVVVLDVDNWTMGIVVSEVCKVIHLPSEAIQPPPLFDAAAQGVRHLVAGEARVGDDLVTILDVSCLTHQPEQPLPAEDEAGPEADGSAEPAETPRHFYPEATPEANIIPFADSISYLFADANDIFYKAKIEPIAEHPEIAQLLEWFGKNQRERVYRCVAAICKESAEHGEVYFRDSEEAHQLSALKTRMYDEFYDRLPRADTRTWLGRCYDKLLKLRLNADPATVLALMTDEEVIAVGADSGIRFPEDLSHLAIGELLNDSDAISKLDFMNPDLDW